MKKHIIKSKNYTTQKSDTVHFEIDRKWEGWTSPSTGCKKFDTTCQTVHRWCKRAFHRGRESFRDKQREPKEGKITQTVELTILHLRVLFDWGTERIKKGLFSLPPFMQEILPECVQGVNLSRNSINNVLRKHKLNGYKKQSKGWKFFRAKKPDELWQLDYDPGTEDIKNILLPLFNKHKPEKILTDNGKQKNL